MTDSIKSNFPIFKKRPDLVYLDNAATTQRPKVVIDAISEFYSFENSNIHRGVYDLSNQASKRYEDVREKVRKFINANSVETIGFTKGTTESINIVANSLVGNKANSDDNVVITLMEHHANILPWQRLCEQTGRQLRVAKIDANGNLDMKHLFSLIDENTLIVSVVHISNTLGTINPVKEIIDYSHKLNVPVMVDAAQSAALYELDAQQLDYDFLAFSGHKIFGPFGTGLLYVKEKYKDQIKPLTVGGGMIQNVSINKTDYKGFPYNLEAGTANISGVIGLGAAIDYLNSLDRKILRKKIVDLTAYGFNKLNEMEKVTVLASPTQRSGILSFVIDGIHPHDIASFLNKDGIAVRAGMHCTQPLLESMDLYSTARASLSIYNTKEDIDRLVESLRSIIKIWS